MIALLITASLGVAGASTAQVTAPATTPLSKEAYATAKKHADTQYQSDKAACASLSGNAKDICVADAKGKAAIARADAEAGLKNTAKARESARVARAQAGYDVALEKCDDLAGNPKDVCVKMAKADLVKRKANAKVDRVTADTRQDAAMQQTAVRKEASADKRDADYNVAIEKCDALAGPAKDACIGDAKARYGKS